MNQDEINPRKVCDMCGRQFISKIGEVYCETCAAEFEEEGDREEIARIVGRRGVDWVSEAAGKEFVKKLRLPISVKRTYWEAVRDMAAKVGNADIHSHAEANIKALKNV